MNKQAWLFIWLVFALGGALALWAVLRADWGQLNWLEFLILTGLAIAADLFNVEGPGRYRYHSSLICYFAGIVLLQPAEYVIMILVTHLVEWGKERLARSEQLRDWYVQPFNLAMHISLGLLAGQIYGWSTQMLAGWLIFGLLAGVVLAAFFYVGLNHLIAGEFLVLARGISWKQSNVMKFENINTDFFLLAYGFVVAYLMRPNPWMILLALTPVYLIYRALAVPGLKQQVNTDVKTGLWNAAYFMRALETELARAERFQRPLTVVMADIDLLRNINNAYGHLAGDVVLKGVARILKSTFREYDVVARFGGEEFTIIMPETPPLEAFHRIEAVRQEIENEVFETPTTRARIKATMSFGLAGLNGRGLSAKEILHQADMAVYQAKVEGRNQVKAFQEG